MLGLDHLYNKMNTVLIVLIWFYKLKFTIFMAVLQSVGKTRAPMRNNSFIRVTVTCSFPTWRHQVR